MGRFSKVFEEQNATVPEQWISLHGHFLNKIPYHKMNLPKKIVRWKGWVQLEEKTWIQTGPPKGVGLRPEFTCWNVGAFLRHWNFALTLPFLPVQFCRVLAKGRLGRILFGLNLAFLGVPWGTSLFARRKKILQHKCSFIWVGIPSFDMMKLCPNPTERHQFGAVRNFLHCMLLWPSAPVQAVPHHIMTVYVTW